MRCTRAFLVLVPFCVAVGVDRSYARAPVCYATPDGNDLSDGSTWSAARADIMACYDALPSAGGTIYIRDGLKEGGGPIAACKASDPPGCGIWIMGRFDPNYAHPPAGWRTLKSGSVSIIGVGGTGYAMGRAGNMVVISAGSNVDTNHPAFWLSNVQNLSFRNIFVLGYPAQLIKLSIDSTGARDGGGGSVQVKFDNIAGLINMVPGNGPSVDIGAGTFWVFMTDFTFEGNQAEQVRLLAPNGCRRAAGIVACSATNNLPSSWSGSMRLGVAGVADDSFNGVFNSTITGPRTFSYPNAGLDAVSGGGAASSDRAQAVLMDGGTRTSPDVYFEHGMVTNAGIRSYAGTAGNNFTVVDLWQEDGLSPPVDIATCHGPTGISIQTVQPADANIELPAVRANCPPNSAGGIVVEHATVNGPATVASVGGPRDRYLDPNAYRQTGVIRGRLYGQQDTARRGFGPVVARWHNYANQVSSTWGSQICGNRAVTPTPSAAPNGTNNAARSTTDVCFGSVAPSLGDWIIGGAWVRSEAADFAGGVPLTLQCLGCRTVPNPESPTYMMPKGSVGRGEWQWIFDYFRVVSIGHSPRVTFKGSASRVNPTDFFAPVLVDLGSSPTPNEAAEAAAHLQSYRDDASVGQVSLLRGEQLKADSIQVGSAATITSGAGAPKAPAAIGSVYLRTDGDLGETFYVYERDGWKAVK